MKIVIFLFGLIALAACHSYLTAPKSRRMSYGCRIGGPPEFPVNCPGPCESPKDRSNPNVINTARGAALKVDWPRNNHGGGFIRIAWAKHEDSDDHQSFNKGVQTVSCHETGYDGNPNNLSPNRGCASDDPKNPLGGDSGSAEGGERACRLYTTIPTWLSDGKWTMQWAWYGASYGYLGDYYSCADFIVSGGSALTAQTKGTFKGGDVIYPNENVCQFSTADRPHYCWSEPCSDIYNSTFKFGKYTLNKGQAYLPEVATIPATSAAPATSAPPPPPTSQAPTPATSKAEDVPVPDIRVTVTVSLNIAPRLVDLTVFTYELSRTLQVPAAAFPEIDINLDQSTETTTIVVFKILNKLLADGSRVDPIATAYKLKELSQTEGSSVKTSALLSTMTVLDVEQPQETSSNFVGSAAFVIIVAVIGGVVLIAVAVVVTVVIVKKRRSSSFF